MGVLIYLSMCIVVDKQMRFADLVNLRGYNKMYYESAENHTITKQRAIQELSKHGIDDTTEFFNDLGNFATYQAQTVLEWLGY